MKETVVITCLSDNCEEMPPLPPNSRYERGYYIVEVDRDERVELEALLRDYPCWGLGISE